MRPGAVVVIEVRPQDATQMARVEDDDVVETLAVSGLIMWLHRLFPSMLEAITMECRRTNSYLFLADGVLSRHSQCKRLMVVVDQRQ